MASFSFVQLASMASRCSVRSASSPSRASSRSTTGRVGLLGEGDPLDLELADTPLDDVDLRGQRVDLDAELGGRLVHEVDGLVGEEAAGEVAVGQHRGRHQRGVLDADAVVHLVALLQPAEDRDRVVDAGLADEHLLEAALEGGVLLDVLRYSSSVVAPIRRSWPRASSGLSMLPASIDALGRAGADHGVELVDEGDDLALGVGDLLEHRLEPLLELAAVLRARRPSNRGRG